MAFKTPASSVQEIDPKITVPGRIKILLSKTGTGAGGDNSTAANSGSLAAAGGLLLEAAFSNSGCSLLLEGFGEK